MTDEANIWAPHANAVEWIKAGGEVQTMDCRAVRVICTDCLGAFPVVGLVTFNGSEIVGNWTANGLPACGGFGNLIPAPRRHTRWVNFYQGGGTGRARPTKADADLAAGATRIACVEVTFTEGEGL